MSRSPLYFFLGSTSLLVLFSGCGEPPYQLAPVSGLVTLDGVPLADGVVNFQPQGQSGKTAAPGSVSRTDSEGKYQLMTVNDEPGASLGRHKVKIYSYSPESAPVGDNDAGPNQERVPDRYNYRTRLTYDVPDVGTDQADFELTSQPE